MSHQGSTFREHLPDLSIARFTTMQKQNAHEYAQAFKSSGQPPWLHGLYLHWRRLFEEPYKGITNDGKVRDGLYQLQDEGVPIEAITSAANAMLDRLSESQRKVTCYHIDSPEWRSWSNPEFLLSDKGIRLDEITAELREDVLGVLKTTLSPAGYEKAVGATRVNHFLGELVKSPAIMNEYSYNFVLFGQPSKTRPWGFSFYGHHLCLNIFLHQTQIIISPSFIGAEPNLVDQGPYKGTRILNKEESLGLRLMQDLPKDQQARAQVYKLMKDPAMPHGRWNHDDQRHLCGAYRDNRVVSNEGILVSQMTGSQQDMVLAITEEFLIYLPERARQLRLEQVKSFFSETYWCWIGGYTDEDPFYYRIQSPVIIIEFDHHSGVFLNNPEPAKFHIHTLLRMPNGGDYGMALRPLIKGQEQAFLWEG
ncbi:uncharacterized protein NECHADRAFT_51556 [Fusarium vanettenii 77-13-4]|uniref:DUF3500 domain-containing protein n=1 Tax=Fusarium vanettenii (strain ATCC MYA-4622 / CBS 123669 / FGSC 9596 / NRRL 45880 / 77-13-4) TaxID=660122 RepID=C7ZES6_FUSV7|nr:uncharacterized protein NECHADRAFT_51556 [Fusarium vanettenii 77-13-4]EEU37428.1 hypothetical protein NECHADRAFT_51556 [Fusarium vanettenii 77-13-4]